MLEGSGGSPHLAAADGEPGEVIVTLPGDDLSVGQAVSDSVMSPRGDHVRISTRTARAASARA
jgi:hypothetical protein